jgi:hypothetical protein
MAIVFFRVGCGILEHVSSLLTWRTLPRLAKLISNVDLDSSQLWYPTHHPPTAYQNPWRLDSFGYGGFSLDNFISTFSISLPALEMEFARCTRWIRGTRFDVRHWFFQMYTCGPIGTYVASIVRFGYGVPVVLNFGVMRVP